MADRSLHSNTSRRSHSSLKGFLQAVDFKARQQENKEPLVSVLAHISPAYCFCPFYFSGMDSRGIDSACGAAEFRQPLNANHFFHLG